MSTTILSGIWGYHFMRPIFVPDALKPEIYIVRENDGKAYILKLVGGGQWQAITPIWQSEAGMLGDVERKAKEFIGGLFTGYPASVPHAY